MSTPPEIVVPPGYNPDRMVDDLGDMGMRVLLAAQSAGRLEEVLDSLEPHIEELRDRA